MTRALGATVVFHDRRGRGFRHLRQPARGSMMLWLGRLAPPLVASAVVLSVDDGLRADGGLVREPPSGVIREGGFRGTLVAWGHRFVPGGYGFVPGGYGFVAGGYRLVAGGYRRVNCGGSARRGMGS